MRFGLDRETGNKILAVFSRYREVNQAIIYGSRALGTQREGSDIDLTLTGKDLDLKILNRIESDLDDLLLPYSFDLSLYRHINNPSLINHIERVGILFFERGPSRTVLSPRNAALRSDSSSAATTGLDQGAVIKKGWQTKTLEEACQFSNGLWKGEDPPFVKVGVIRNTNFTKEGTLDDSDIAYIDVEAKKLEKRRLRFGDIILEKSGGGPKQPVGRVVLFNKEEGEFSFSNFTAALRVIDPNELDFRFLHKFLHWTYVSGVTEGMQSNSTGIRNLDNDAYKAIEIAFPPLAEQQRIVALLDEAFAGLATAKANAEKNLQNARAIFESHLQSIFTQRGPGWTEKSLGELAQFKNGLNYSKNSCGQTLSLVGVSDFQDNYFVPLLELQSATIDGNLSEDYTILPNDILTVRSNGSKHLVGRCMLVGDVDEVVSYSGFIIRIRFDIKSIFPQFLLHFMKCQVTRHTLTAGGGGANITNINQEKLSSLIVPLPPYNIQVKVAAALDSIREETQRLARIYEQKIAALEALKKSLLHQAFAGEL